jgi:hypothetical protein
MPSDPEVQRPTSLSAVQRALATTLPQPATPTRGRLPSLTSAGAPALHVSPTQVARARATEPTIAELSRTGVPAPILPGTLVTQTVHLDLYRVDGSLLMTTVLELAPQFEEAIQRVELRMGARLAGRVAIGFEPSQTGPCALRGLTRSHERSIQLYYGPDTSQQLIVPIVAHELAHELQHDYYGWDAHRRSDTILLEGQATWASADYSRGADGRPTWTSAAEQALAKHTLLPLTTDLERDCRRTTRNAAYTGWASFVDFLIVRYGRERFDMLYRSGRGRDPGSADYAEVYGKGLDALDQDWRVWLAEGSRR